ncbi:unnamed protein product, partial [Ectocarpus sp. 12 AP-2014]
PPSSPGTCTNRTPSSRAASTSAFCCPRHSLPAPAAPSAASSPAAEEDAGPDEDSPAPPAVLHPDLETSWHRLDISVAGEPPSRKNGVDSSARADMAVSTPSHGQGEAACPPELAALSAALLTKTPPSSGDGDTNVPHPGNQNASQPASARSISGGRARPAGHTVGGATWPRESIASGRVTALTIGASSACVMCRLATSMMNSTSRCRTLSVRCRGSRSPCSRPRRATS